MFEHVLPIKMGYHDAVGGGNHVREWCSLGQRNIKSWLCLASFAVVVNSSVV
jgi:hypothetical protein